MYVGFRDGATSGVIDQVARAIEVDDLLYLDRCKAILMVYLTGIFKGLIPPYYSYFREDQTLNTVQQVVAFVQKGVADKDWNKIQTTLDDLEKLSLATTIPQYILWPNLATPDQTLALKTEMSAYFELDNTKPAAERTIENFLGIDLTNIKTYLLWGVGIYAGLVLLPIIVPAVKSLTPKSQS